MQVNGVMICPWVTVMTRCRLTYRARTQLRHRFPLLMYSPIMAVIAAPIALHSSRPASLSILVVIVLLAALGAAGYFGGREYVNRRFNRRNWR
jgi:lipopolysaccharide export LptBFGC system permease protein LptF